MTGDAEGLIASLASSYGKGENSVQPNPGLAGHFPLGAVTVSRNGYGAAQVALAWLLALAPNVLLIPGTTNRIHLRENLAASALSLGDDEVAQLTAQFR